MSLLACLCCTLLVATSLGRAFDGRRYCLPSQTASDFKLLPHLPLLPPRYDVCDLCGALLASDIQQLSTRHLASGEQCACC